MNRQSPYSDGNCKTGSSRQYETDSAIIIKCKLVSHFTPRSAKVQDLFPWCSESSESRNYLGSGVIVNYLPLSEPAIGYIPRFPLNSMFRFPWVSSVKENLRITRDPGYMSRMTICSQAGLLPLCRPLHKTTGVISTLEPLTGWSLMDWWFAYMTVNRQRRIACTLIRKQLLKVYSQCFAHTGYRN